MATRNTYGAKYRSESRPATYGPDTSPSKPVQNAARCRLLSKPELRHYQRSACRNSCCDYTCCEFHSTVPLRIAFHQRSDLSNRRSFSDRGHMQIDHGGSQVFMPQVLLNQPEVYTRLEQVSCIAVITTGSFCSTLMRASFRELQSLG